MVRRLEIEVLGRLDPIQKLDRLGRDEGLQHLAHLLGPDVRTHAYDHGLLPAVGALDGAIAHRILLQARVVLERSRGLQTRRLVLVGVFSSGGTLAILPSSVVA